ncbi:MAG: shikimate dehydrogenase [Gammaproteobacteria bacterium CG22_combo_CG10-13_8_21_14_all_40_8]|nr:MAG: shikimate dehydrogenase [Gammaproteobacteria bacterium CG22_combo_CG10-13_8_21_14_all_40_8]
MIQLALFGDPVLHSQSPQIHLAFANQFNMDISYQKQQISDQHFEKAVAQFFQQGGKGLNITVPYKPRAYRLAAICSAAVAQCGAANTLWMENGQIYADNTDGAGFILDLKSHYPNLIDKDVLILGAGGAVRGILQPLLNENPKSIYLVNRTLENAQMLIKDIQSNTSIQAFNFDIPSTHSPQIIINALSDDSHIQKILEKLNLEYCEFFYDLKYGINAIHSLSLAQKMGIKQTSDGLGMLLGQAALSFEIWTGLKPDIELIHKNELFKF